MTAAFLDGFGVNAIQIEVFVCGGHGGQQHAETHFAELQ
jgi:translation elongation factor EF-1beta